MTCHGLRCVTFTTWRRVRLPTSLCTQAIRGSTLNVPHGFFMYTGPATSLPRSQRSNASRSTHSWAYQLLVDAFKQRSTDPSTSAEVALLVKNDLDALCAAVILRLLLAKDGVPAYIWPITYSKGWCEWAQWLNASRQRQVRVRLVHSHSHIAEMPRAFICRLRRLRGRLVQGPYR